MSEDDGYDGSSAHVHLGQRKVNESLSMWLSYSSFEISTHTVDGLCDHSLHRSHFTEASHLDTRHGVIIECGHLANGCVLKCGCIGLMLFHNISCLDTIICYITTIGIVPDMPATFVTLWLHVVQPLANVHETKWTPHVKRENDVAQSYTSSDALARYMRPQSNAQLVCAEPWR